MKLALSWGALGVELDLGSKVGLLGSGKAMRYGGQQLTRYARTVASEFVHGIGDGAHELARSVATPMKDKVRR
jgi:hypothetical protein